MSGPSKKIKKEGKLYLTCNYKKAFSLLQTIEGIIFGLVRLYVTLYCISRIMFKLDLVLNYTKNVGIPMGTTSAPLVADLFYFCYERDFMTSISNDNQADFIEAFN